MTREELIDIIHKSDNSVTCPDLLEDCDGICETCAEALLEEYENNIREEMIVKFRNKMEQTELYGCDECNHQDDDIHCWDCIAEQLKGELNAR
ncbi:MAG: hypothetical protein Q4A15_11415 [Prevotellaceae bacterium]|nr:hypothetical protein [Prevotellaceae bacterium]